VVRNFHLPSYMGIRANGAQPSSLHTCESSACQACLNALKLLSRCSWKKCLASVVQNSQILLSLRTAVGDQGSRSREYGNRRNPTRTQRLCRWNVQTGAYRYSYISTVGLCPSMTAPLLVPWTAFQSWHRALPCPLTEFVLMLEAIALYFAQLWVESQKVRKAI
jgi:hypothetical protein